MHKLAFFVSVAVLTSQAAGVSIWGQCGGMNYNGSTACDAGSSCVKVSDWYSQCQPGSAPVTSDPVPSSTAVVTPPPATTPPPAGTTTAADPPSSTSFVAPSASPTGLTARFYAKGKKFWGTCADPGTLGRAANVDVIKADFGQVTPENSMKWDATEPQRGTFNFGNADRLVEWAVSNGKLIRGHTLVWHSQLPGWVSSINDRTTLTTVINNHITNVAGRFKGKLYGTELSSSSWDVVNECLTEQGGLRDSVFSRVLGESFITVAFTQARSVDPGAVLYINDYNLDSNNAKTQGMVALIKRINANSKLIDGVGTQMHLGSGGSGGALAALQALAGAPVDEVAITELDIAGASANDYTAVLRACLQVEKCQAVTSWGVADPDSWRSGTSPLLFDGQYRPKAAYTALIQALQ